MRVSTPVEVQERRTQPPRFRQDLLDLPLDVLRRTLTTVVEDIDEDERAEGRLFCVLAVPSHCPYSREVLSRTDGKAASA
jgi:hypothetical protein